MSKTFDTQTYTIGALLGRYERRQVILPEFQRSYSWEKAQVRTFIDDLLVFTKDFISSPSTASYFLGSIVFIERDEHLLLLDGQQRLATAIIILSAMRDLGRTLDKKGFTKGSDLARDIQRELIEKDTEPITYSLILGELDESFFFSAIKNDPPLIPNSKLRSHQLIQAAYGEAYQRLADVIHAKDQQDAIKSLKAIRDALTKGMALIGIVVQNEEDAYTIFETLNDRGLRLSVPDLVLNLLMRRATNDKNRKIVRQHWNSMLRELGRRDVSRFLRHLWVSRYGDLKSEGLFVAIRRELESTKISSVEFAETCADECDVYVALMETNLPLSKTGLHNLEGIVKYLQITSAPPLLLSGYKSLNPQDFEKLLNALIAIHVRYLVFSNQNPLDLESRVFEAARIIRNLSKEGLSSSKILAGAKAKLKELNIADKVIKENADRIILERAEAIWLVTSIANSIQSRTKELAMAKANLEHIFPQNPSKEWTNQAELESLVWHIGNLTILGERINRQAQNKGFSEKLSQHYNESEIKMTSQLSKYSKWTRSEILARSKELINHAVTLWQEI